MKKKKKLNPSTIVLGGMVLEREMILAEIEHHLKFHGLMSLNDFNKIKDKYSPKQVINHD